MYINLKSLSARKFNKLTFKIELPIGISKYQYNLFSDEKYKNELKPYTIKDTDNFDEEFCYYCGSEAVVVRKAFLHDGLGYNLWIVSDPKSYYPLCNECHSALGPKNMLYLGRAKEIKSNLKGLNTLKPFLTIPNVNSYESDYHFNFNGELIGKTNEGINTINKLSLNRSGLLLRRRNVINEIIDTISTEMLNISEPKKNIPIFKNPIDLNFSSEYFDYIFYVALKENIKNNLLIDSKNNLILEKDYNIIKYEHDEVKKKEILYSKNTIDIYKLIDKYPNIYKHITRYYCCILNHNLKKSYRANSNIKARNLKNLHLDFNNILQRASDNKNNNVVVTNSKINKITFTGIRNFQDNSEITINNRKSIIIIGENGVGKSSILELIDKCFGRQDNNLINLITNGYKSAKVNVNYINKLDDTIIEQKSKKPSISSHHSRFYVIKINENRVSSTQMTRNLDLLVKIRENKEIFDFIGQNLIDLFDLPISSELIINNNVALIKTNNNLIEIEHLSSGYRSVFSIFMYVITYFVKNTIFTLSDLKLALENSMILIDELELHLHPKFKKNILAKLNRVFPNTLLITTTHDPLILTSCDKSDQVIVLKEIEGKTHIKTDLPNVENYSVEQILTSPIFGLSTINRLKTYESKIYAYHLALKNKDWDLVDNLQDELANSGYFGNSYREFIISSVLDLYNSDDIQPNKNTLLKELKNNEYL
ncbi:AAA family ATPase [Aliivibrio sp. EL58]|uniref:AAA family ATPase n=1 Tax=Aliivibrio sp. EL58 TaxID=2107582 RepID=UPI000EFA6A16|nr:AAA family ATPase [Aliivibrio sp. EL58]